MGETIQLTAEDGHTFDVYKADPSGAPKGALLVIQEIFGVNSHMRGIADGFAADGYAVLCPALFDRGDRGFEVGYTPDDIAKGRDARAKIPWDKAVLDMKATVAALKKQRSAPSAIAGAARSPGLRPHASPTSRPASATMVGRSPSSGAKRPIVR